MHIVIPVLQLGILIGICCGPFDRVWTFWLLVASLSVVCLYFSFMLVYKLYRARITFATFTKESVRFYIGFHAVELKADELSVTLCDTGKPSAKNKYAVVHETNNGDNGFMLVVSCTKSLAKFKDCAPEPLLKFIIACTLPQVLESARKDASDELKQLIDEDIEEREKTRLQEESAARKKRKNKK